MYVIVLAEEEEEEEEEEGKGTHLEQDACMQQSAS
jgi:hypothetical protein